MSALAGRSAQSHGHDPLGRLVRDLGKARGACLVAQQTFNARRHEALLPSPDSSLAHASRTHNRRRAQPIGRAHHDHGSPNMFLGTVAVVNDCLQALAVSRAKLEVDASSHSLESHASDPKGIPLRTLMSASIH